MMQKQADGFGRSKRDSHIYSTGLMFKIFFFFFLSYNFMSLDKGVSCAKMVFDRDKIKCIWLFD